MTANAIGAAVSVRSLSRTFGGAHGMRAVDGLDFDIDEGEFLVLLGPSGCGKTTTLRCLAGLESPDDGRIVLGEQMVFDASRKLNLPPERRGIGMVFQSYALWPHLTVRKNLEYPLRARKLKQGLREDWAAELAAVVECENLLDRYPGQLSGGQQQRVALARGLVARPDLVLFDEPLSNLDARLRKDVRSELHHLHRRLGFTAVYVTHDQEEAFALGDRLAIMRSGKIEQIDTPARVFENPASDYVANFVGMSNRLPLTFDGQTWAVAGVEMLGPFDLPRQANQAAVGRVRAEDLTLLQPGERTHPDLATFSATLIDSSYAGRGRDVMLEVNGTALHATVAAGRGVHWVDAVKPGAPLMVGFRQDVGSFYDSDGALIVDKGTGATQLQTTGVA